MVTVKLKMDKPTMCGQCPFYTKYSGREKRGFYVDYGQCKLGYIDRRVPYDWYMGNMFEGCRLGKDPKIGIVEVER